MPRPAFRGALVLGEDCSPSRYLAREDAPTRSRERDRGERGVSEFVSGARVKRPYFLSRLRRRAVCRLKPVRNAIRHKAYASMRMNDRQERAPIRHESPEVGRLGKVGQICGQSTHAHRLDRSLSAQCRVGLLKATMPGGVDEGKLIWNGLPRGFS